MCETVRHCSTGFNFSESKASQRDLNVLQADKDFVWTLWKRLQAEKPDISSAVSMVIARWESVWVTQFQAQQKQETQL